MANTLEHARGAVRGGRERYAAGLQFGSQFVGGLMPGQVVDYLPEPQLDEVTKPGGVCRDAGASISGRATATDGRRCLNASRASGSIARRLSTRGSASMRASGTFPDSPLRGVYARNRVYARVTGWESFEPWLSRVESMEAETLWRSPRQVPPEWYGGDTTVIERLMEQMLARRSRVRELIAVVSGFEPEPFPMWEKGTEDCGAAAVCGG